MGAAPPKMESGPPKVMETVIGILIPPACREEVLGDLHERYDGLPRYFLEACFTVPMVIASRIRRTTEPGLLLLEAMVLYLSLTAGALVSGQTHFLTEQNGYSKLAVLIAMALLALVLVDAYAGVAARLILAPAAALGALLFQFRLQASNPELAIPSFRMVLFGSLAGMLLVTALRWLFAPGDNRTTGA
ncbi:MAG: hypothetical protein LAP40_13265 [Acidobacteriia bacterium]|nr:hypothetical protein [Terriglobia bacterium]